jgi:hypothetical protein
MGCGSAKSNTSIAAIAKKQSIHESYLINEHKENFEVEVIDQGKSQVQKADIIMDVSAKENKTDLYVLSQSVPIVYEKHNQTENQESKDLLQSSNLKPAEKPSFPSHEPNFDFDFLEKSEEKKDDEHLENQMLEDVLKELDNI